MSEQQINKGMLVGIFHNPYGDCTNGGVSSKAKSAIIVSEKMDKIFSGDDDCPVLELCQRRDGTYFCKPVGETRWTMFGGNFAWKSDRRFRKVCPNPIPIHDRIEQ